MTDVLLYAHRDGRDYVAAFDDAWYRWPARDAGWLSRHRCDAAVVDDCFELPPELAYLGLVLSGAPHPEPDS